ncbi:MAG TPA: hypothetical protein VFU30_14405 [Gaiellaceae bacterium]|nr:hypothetical protein [Gaiellaceae bacterium]
MANTTTYNPGQKLSIFALAFGVLALAIGSAFAVGWVIGRILL